MVLNCLRPVATSLSLVESYSAAYDRCSFTTVQLSEGNDTLIGTQGHGLSAAISPGAIELKALYASRVA
jgi:hypothetical protein